MGLGMSRISQWRNPTTEIVETYPDPEPTLFPQCGVEVDRDHQVLNERCDRPAKYRIQSTIEGELRQVLVCRRCAEQFNLTPSPKVDATRVRKDRRA